MARHALFAVAALSLFCLPGTRAFQLQSKCLPLLQSVAPSAVCLRRRPPPHVPFARHISLCPSRAQASALPLHAQLPNGGSGGPGGFLNALRQQLSNLGGRIMRGSWNRLLLPTILLAMLASGQFGWLWGVVNTVFLFIFIIPLIGVIGVNLWVKMSLVNGECPNCSSKVMLPKNGQSVCFSCGTPLLVDNGKISRAGMYNTRNDMKTGKPVGVDVVDVEAIDIDSREAK